MDNYSKKYYHKEPLRADYERRHGTVANVRVLLCEGKGVCPECKKLIQAEGKIENYIGNIAHIYSRKEWYNNKKKKKLPQGMFPNYYHIETADQLDNIENLILLCKSCHKTYDKKNVSYEEYGKILKYKEEAAKSLTQEDRLYNAVLFLCEELGKNGIEKSKIANIEYDFKKTKVIKKFAINNFDTSFDSEVQLYEDSLINNTLINIRNYYEVLDNNEELSDDVIKQIGSVYKELRDIHNSKREILDKMQSSLKSRNLLNYSKEIEAILSYCIMKCEVLDNE